VPMPPSCAMAMARRASVTVSMAAEARGRFRRMLRDREVARLVSRGNTWENAGTSNTSSKVSALPRRRMGKAPDAKGDYTEGAFPEGAAPLAADIRLGFDDAMESRLVDRRGGPAGRAAGASPVEVEGREGTG